MNPGGAGASASPVFTGYVLFAVSLAAELTRVVHAAVLHRRA